MQLSCLVEMFPMFDFRLAPAPCQHIAAMLSAATPVSSARLHPHCSPFFTLTSDFTSPSSLVGQYPGHGLSHSQSLFSSEVMLKQADRPH